MSTKFAFHATNDPKKLKELYELCGVEWGGGLTSSEFGDVETQQHIDSLTKGRKIQGFYLEDKASGTLVATTIISEIKGFVKPTDRTSSISSIPDPSSIGLKPIKFLLIGFVVTHRDYRRQGLAQLIVENAIKFTEEEIIATKLHDSDTSKNDSFANMVTDQEGKVDGTLANYYLGKEYMWILYSGVGKFYERFGFKGFPLEFFKIPLSSLSEQQEVLIEQLLDETNKNNFRKRVRLLRGTNPDDQEIIKTILQTKELTIVSELNKTIFHSELQSTSKSSSSLTNMNDILAAAHEGRTPSLGSIVEDSNSTASKNQSGRRKSSVHHFAIPRIALKPDYDVIQWDVAIEKFTAHCSNNEQAVKYTDIQGLILHNELQKKSYYIIWNTLMQRALFIMGIGELQSGFEFNPTSAPRSRSSSFSELNELGGYNFQDYDILLSAACYVSKKRNIPGNNPVYVSINDLPNNIPTQVLYDYLLNFFPNSLTGSVSNNNSTSTSKNTENKIQIINDAELGVLPMLRRFGDSSPEFEIDWSHSGMWSFG
ncbi:uncharacterized protein RJT21DRAFT_56785 [Scheffersomyces amazonensis]|uniref:uncharacterized protein n=1 Tax=Scheffersomyces amazonensis TaxID=1078765 RepID=UPI00315D009A